MAALLPIELLSNILSCLPLEDLIRFTIISKSWYSLIKSPNFAKLYLNKTLTSNPNRHLIICNTSLHSFNLDNHHKNNHLSFIELNHPLKHLNPVFHGTCNGVVCASDDSRNHIFLFNPFTNLYRQIQNPNPEALNVVLGFGYDTKSDDYKVLQLLLHCNSIDKGVGFEAKVYSVKNDLWKCVEEGIPFSLHFFAGYSVNRFGILVNESLHYVTEDSSSNELFIAKFDLVSDTFTIMDCPDYDKDRAYVNVVDISELGGCLCLLITHGILGYVYNMTSHTGGLDLKFHGADLWLMKEYGKKESWVRLFSIREPESVGIDGFIRAVVYSEDGGRILLEVDGLELGWFDLESKSFERCSTEGLLVHPFVTGSFVGSLVSLGDCKVQLEGPGGGASRKKKKKRDDMDGFLAVGFNLKL